MHTSTLPVPRFDLVPSDAPVVTHWGRVGTLMVRPGDRLVVEPGDGPGWLFLVPRGWGRPMVGRRERGRLLAEPGGVPASPHRWAVAGRVVAVERELGRGVPTGSLMWVELRVEGVQASVPRGRNLQTMRGRWMSPSELDALSIRAAVAQREGEARVALGVGPNPESARLAADGASCGHLRVACVRPPAGKMIVGPWGQSKHASADKMQLGLFSDRPRGHETGTPIER